MTLTAVRKLSLVSLGLAALLAGSACAALQPTSATGPRGAEQDYPILLTEDSGAMEASIAALNRLAQPSGNVGALESNVQPVTATIRGLPARANTPLYLPKVGATAVMNEEETRESLRRFIRETQELIGADPAKLTLIERTDLPDGNKLAIYEQRAFRYPIRGGYGKLQIRFTSDRRVIDLSSSCIPDAERMQTTLSGLTVALKPEDAVKQLREKETTYTDAAGMNRNLRLPANAELTPRSLVVYVRPAPNQTNALEFHIAWEVQSNGQPLKLIYLDAVNGEILAAE